MRKRFDFGRPIITGGRAILEWIGKYELNVMLALLLFVGAVYGFVEIADAVAAGRTMKFDEWAIRTMRKPGDPAAPIGPKWLAEVGRDLTALGGVAFLTLLTAAIAGFFWLKRMYAAMILVLVATLGGLTVSMFLKFFFDRPRPDFVPHLSHVYTSSF